MTCDIHAVTQSDLTFSFDLKWWVCMIARVIFRLFSDPASESVGWYLNQLASVKRAVPESVPVKTVLSSHSWITKTVSQRIKLKELKILSGIWQPPLSSQYMTCGCPWRSIKFSSRKVTGMVYKSTAPAAESK